MSHMPLWLAPSEPVSPARSSTNVTPALCSATSMSTWSNARLRNVAYTATTGCSPPKAIPAADVAACCSAIPTSNTRVGNSAANGARPTGWSIAAVMADDVRAATADAHELVGEDAGPLEPRRRDGQPGLGVDLADRVEPVRDVLLGRDVPAALLGDDVHDDRPAERLRAAQRPLDRAHVVPVDRADVLDAQVLEHALRHQDVLDALLHAVQRVVRRAAGRAGPAQRALAPGQDVLVAAAWCAGCRGGGRGRRWSARTSGRCR